MLDSYCQPNTATEKNASSLQTLSRTLKLSRGDFSLILVRCNYEHLREQIIDRLREDCAVEIREILLPPSVKTLYTTIETELAGSQPEALMVSGLESVNALDRVLTSTNYVREEFRNNFPFPVVLWVTDNILKKLIRLVTDIESWTTTIEFALAPEELVDFLAKSADRVFSALLETGNWHLTNSAILGANSLAEIEAARQDLANAGVRLEPAIEASLQFVSGRQEYACHRIEAAISLYQKSLNFWKYQVAILGGDSTTFRDLLFTVHPAPVLQGVLLFHIGLCYRFQGEKHRNGNLPYWTEAKNYFQQCIEVLESAGRQDLAAKFINQLGEVLQHLEDWDALWSLAVKSRRLHQVMEDPTAIHLAQDYGFLARVALEQQNWEGAKEWARVALDVLNSKAGENGRDKPVKSQHQGSYLLILAAAQKELGEIEEAIANLERARSETEPCYSPQLHLRVLEMLRSLYFERGEYLKAFQLKQDYRSIEHTYGFRAFIGAGRLQPHREAVNPAAETVASAAAIADEIAASGREEALNKLLDRAYSTQHKLTVIYGQSGVGKSSILTGGLVPALKQRTIETRTVLPVVLQVYNNWPREMTRQLFVRKAEIFDRAVAEEMPGFSGEDFQFELSEISQQAVPEFDGEVAAENEDAELRDAPVEVVVEQQSIEYAEIIKQLQLNAEHLVTVLIFDQFEEFFFVWKEPAERQIFFDFLRECLKIKYLKVIISLREDYLHYLLEFSRPKKSQQPIINDILGDILSKDILFYLGNFSLGDAQSVIRTLTERSQFYLEPELIAELVEDLAGETGEVRPIELQVVGAQLQEEQITTLEQYQELGDNPKQKLVEMFLEEVIKDCGPENEVAARRVLYLLTDDDDIRPLKTRAELASDLATFEEADKLDLVLELLVNSSLVFRWTELPAELYQLVHDYLVSFIQQQQELDTKAEFEKLRRQHEISQDEIEQLRKEKELNALLSEAREKQHEAETQLYKTRRWQLRLAIMGLIAVAGLAVLAFYQAQLGEKARQQAERARIDALKFGSEALVLSNEKDQLGVLQTSIKIGKDALQSKSLPATAKSQIAERLRQAVSGVQESNRLEQHSKFVLDVSVSPDGSKVASASADKTVKLWSKEGKLLKTFKHGDSVTSVSFSPDGKTIATASADRKVRIWQVDNDKSAIATLSGHGDIVTSISFSADGKNLVSGSHDNSIKIWDVASKKLLQTLRGHRDWVLGVKFSPDGATIASASADKTVKLWNRQGKTQKFSTKPKTLNKHSDIVYSVSFSPSGKEIVSASADTTVKIWNSNGTEIRTLKGHTDEVVSASFSRDGEKIVTGSADDTVKVWSRNGTLLSTFRGHQDDVRAVNFSRDGTVASASKDKMVKLWKPNSTPLNRILSGHGDWVYKVSFSKDGKTIASASRDKTVKLWRADGTLLKTLTGHRDSVTWTSISPDDRAVASASDDKTVKVWNLAGKLLDTLPHGNIVNSVTFSPDGKVIASASADRKLYLWRWNGTQATLLTKLDLPNPVISVSFSPDGKTLAAATAVDDKATVNKNVAQIAASKKVYLWQFNGKEAKSLTDLDHDDSVKSVSFSPDGKTIAAACADKKVYLWRFDGSRANLTEKLEHSDTLESVSFSPDGKLIAAASGGNTVKIWSFNGKNAVLAKTLESSDRVLSASFSPDSKTLAFASRDRSIILWPVENLELRQIVDRSCDWLGDYLQNDSQVAEGDRMLCMGFGKQVLNKDKR